LRGFILHQQCEIAFIELLKPLIPADMLERLLAAIAGEIQTDHPDVAAPARAANTRRRCVPFFRPSANLIMVREDS
jgi:hypothetical protein